MATVGVKRLKLTEGAYIYWIGEQ